MHIQLSVFDLTFLQQEKPCENEIHAIMFSYYQSQSTVFISIRQFDFSPWLHLK